MDAQDYRVIVVGDGTKQSVRDAVEWARQWLGERVASVVIDLDGELDLERMDGDLVVSYGGDGSMLQTVRRMGSAQKPVVGVNFGKLGFLADVVPGKDLACQLESIFNDKVPIEPAMLLEARLEPLRGESESFLALNDVVITRTKVNRMVIVTLSINGEQVTTYHGDGLIAATPVGSTAHSLSAGGPIVHPGMRAVVLTPICPHTLTNRPLVVSHTDEILMVADGENAGLTIDGQVTRGLHPGDRVVIQAAPFEFRRVRVRHTTYFQLLREKLGWGIEPRQFRNKQDQAEQSSPGESP